MFAIAIDGPAGAGKSSVAKAAARALGFIYVDTGALYRTVALHMLRKGIEPADAGAVEAALPGVSVDLRHAADGQHVLLCGEDVTDEIRTPQVSMAASAVSAIPAVRKFLFSLQTGMAERYDVLMDGRDIGTVVYPKADVKVFLTASPAARARRRAVQREGGNLAEDAAAVADPEAEKRILADLKRRDDYDSTREASPLRPADDAVVIDSSDLTFEQVIQRICGLSEELSARLCEER